MTDRAIALLPGAAASESELTLWGSPLAETLPAEELRQMAKNGGRSNITQDRPSFRSRAMHWVTQGVLP